MKKLLAILMALMLMAGFASFAFAAGDCLCGKNDCACAGDSSCSCAAGCDCDLCNPDIFVACACGKGTACKCAGNCSCAVDCDCADCKTASSNLPPFLQSIVDFIQTFVVDAIKKLIDSILDAIKGPSIPFWFSVTRIWTDRRLSNGGVCFFVILPQNKPNFSQNPHRDNANSGYPITIA